MKLYRYQRNSYSPKYDFGIWSGFKVDLIEYEVIKETSKGYWIEHLWKKKFILKSEGGRRRFAYETKEKALINFKARAEKSVKICKTNLKLAEGFLKALESLNPETDKPLDNRLT